MAKLSKKQAQFCQEYILDLNGTQAAIRAGYSARSYFKSPELHSSQLPNDLHGFFGIFLSMEFNLSYPKSIAYVA